MPHIRNAKTATSAAIMVSENGLVSVPAAPYKEFNFAPREVRVEARGDGSLLLRSTQEFTATGRTVCDFLPHWSKEAGERVFLAERNPEGDWRRLSYAEAWDLVGALGEGLIARGMGKASRIAILSGNSIDHALVTLAAMSIGAIVAPISPNYSLLDGGLTRLTEIARIFRPHMVFARARTGFDTALKLPEFREAEIVLGNGAESETDLTELMQTLASQAFRNAFDAIVPELPAKVLFTSGSTGSPKGVINTHGMLVNVVAMASQLTPSDEPPIQLEWLPWHHTMGGNATLNGILRSGGTLYIDDGRPVPHLFGKTLANLEDVSPTTMLNVPAGFIMLADALEASESLCKKFFHRLTRITYGGAAVPESVLNKFQALAVLTTGRRIPVVSGYGLTETSPTVCVTHWPSEISGEIGLPLPGLELKLEPAGNEFELRVRGRTVTPGYYGQPDLNDRIFDEEGFFRTGDLVDFNDRGDPSRGLRFVGRLSENFKLQNGTWVNVGELRVALLNATDGLLQDIILVGENMDTVSLMVWPKVPPDHAIARIDLEGGTRLVDACPLTQLLAKLISQRNKSAGASSRIGGFVVLDQPPSMAHGEITDKGYVNQRAVIARRKDATEVLIRRQADRGFSGIEDLG